MPNSAPDPMTLIPNIDALPGPWGFLAALLYCSFVLHLLLVNAVVGLSAITLAGKLRSGLDFQHRSDLRDQSILLPKGVALLVNFAIPPFLFLQGIYGQFIYAGSILSALWWLSIMAVVMMAYYGLYLNMSQSGISERARIVSLALSLALLLWTAFLLVNNITLMQNPERWTTYRQSANGLFLNLADPQVVPRYLHVLLASLAVGGLCLALSSRYRLNRLGDEDAESARLRERQASGLSCFFYATLAQFPVGGWFLLALPPPQRMLFMAGDATASALFFAALFLTGFALFAARRGRPFAAASSALLTIVLMAGMRAILRSSLLAPYYQPSFRTLEIAPLALFLGSLAVSAAIVVWLVAVYRRQAQLPMLEDADAPARQPDGPPKERAEGMFDHDALLVNEIAMGRMDNDERDEPEQDADARPFGGKRP